MITVLTKPNCPECVKVKEYLKQNGHEYEELQIGPATMDMIPPGAKSAPVVLIDGVYTHNTEILSGYAFSDVKHLDKLDMLDLGIALN